MHTYRAFIEEQMTQRSWSAADLARRARLTPQTISNILSDQREQMTMRPSDRTIDGLATAFGTHRDVILAMVAQAMRLPVGDVVTRGLDTYTDVELVEELLERARQTAYADSTDDGGSPVYLTSRFIPSDPSRWFVGEGLAEPSGLQAPNTTGGEAENRNSRRSSPSILDAAADAAHDIATSKQSSNASEAIESPQESHQ